MLPPNACDHERFSFLCIVKILMFHQHFNTPEGGGAIRSYYLAMALIQRGHQVTMITSCACTTGRTECIEGLEVIYLPVPYNNRFNFYARSWSFIKYVLGATHAGSKYKDYDICYGISVPLTVGICTRWMKFKYGIPYMFEVGDLWPDAPIQLGFIRNKLFQRALFSFEKSIYRQAQSVVALSPPIQAAIKTKAPSTRVDVIPNMADCDFYRPEAKNQELDAKYGTTGKLVVSYIGALGVANGLNHLLDCAEACHASRLPVQFIICGDGAVLDELKATSERKALANITFSGFENRNGVKQIMDITDAVFVSYKKAAILETGCPNKYFDGLAAGKLVIINFGGWIRTDVESHECGFFADPDQPAEFLRKLSPFLADRALLAVYQQRARKLAEEKYSRTQISNLFADLFSPS